MNISHDCHLSTSELSWLNLIFVPDEGLALLSNAYYPRACDLKIGSRVNETEP